MGEEEEPAAGTSGRGAAAEDAALRAGKRERSAAPKELSERKIARMKEKAARRGVVYLSRLPPHLKPQKLRHLLSEHAELGRLYLAPEDALGRRRRARAGGNSGLNFTEGWVEFADKAAARALAARLNGQPMGGRRRSAHYYDLWTMRYLPKFKWEHLTAELAAAKAEREQRLAAEASAAARERDFYLSRVERAKGVAAVVARRAGGAGAATGGAEGAGGGGGGGGGARVLRTYGQRRAKADPVDDAAAPTLSAGVLALIAGRRG